MPAITKDFLLSCATDNGGFTGAQHLVLKQAFNLPRDFNRHSGWLKSLHGFELTDLQANNFYEARLIYSSASRKTMKDEPLPRGADFYNKNQRKKLLEKMVALK